MTKIRATLRELALGDSLAVHALASLPEACRYQDWGPDTEEQTREFVRGAVDAQRATAGQEVRPSWGCTGSTRPATPAISRRTACWAGKLGMTHEGRLRHTSLIRDEWR
jgi:hypothetical protein